MNEEAQELTAGVRPGDVLAGKYRIDRVLGTGGMGVVVGTPTNPSCLPNTGMTGEVVPRDPRTLCCLPGAMTPVTP